MKEYEKVGHKYISDYSLNPALTWVLATSPIMTEVFANSEFVEIDATFKSSVELEYLLNVVCFEYNSLLCKLCSFF